MNDPVIIVDEAEIRKMVEAYFAGDPEVVSMLGKDKLQISPESREAQAQIGRESKSGRISVKNIEAWY